MSIRCSAGELHNKQLHLTRSTLDGSFMALQVDCTVSQMESDVDDAELREYFALVETVSQFDQRLLTGKGWGVTLSLAALGFGFQYRSYRLFVVAAASSLAFWSLGGFIKRHQMRYYPRMRQIEVNRWNRAAESDRAFSSPRIDWSWAQAPETFSGSVAVANEQPKLVTRTKAYALAWLLPHVALPHAITFAIGSVLFALGHSGHLVGFTLGAVSGKE